MLLVGAVVVVGLLAAGTFNLVALAARHETTTPLAFPAGIRHVKVLAGPGDVTVEAGRDDGDGGITGTRTATEGLTAPDHRESVDGDTLTIEWSCPAVLIWCGVSYVLSVPPDVAVEVDGRSADVGLRGLRGPVDVTTTSGDVRADAVADLTVTTSSGDLTVTGADGAVVAGTRSGDVVVNGLAGPTAQVTTSSGDVSLAFSANPMQVEVQTGSGDVSMMLPVDEAAYRLDVRTASGARYLNVREDPAGERRIAVTTGSGDVHITQSVGR